MWWLFSNKKKSNKIIRRYQLFNKLTNIEDSLKNSFFNIKRDINKINNFLYYHDTTISHLKDRVLFLESQVKELRTKNPEKIKEFKEKLAPIEEIPTHQNIFEDKSQLLVKWEDLTNIQQNIFLRLGLLQVESSQKRIAMKHLAEELYPEKEYNDVRSMISDYINLLNEHGLIKKTRKGRQIFVSITEKGLIYYDKTKRKKLLDIISKHKD